MAKNNLSLIKPCPCDRTRLFGQCCEPILNGRACALTASALMRSRYTAYNFGIMTYIKKTQQGSAAKDFDVRSVKRWAARCHWERLIIEQESNPQWDANITTASVTFKAYYTMENKKHCLHENSQFNWENSQWFYVNGQHQHHA